jgi:hypothetical protein
MALVGWLEELLTTEQFIERIDQTNSIITRLLLSNLAKYNSDWRVKSSAQVMSILHSANTSSGKDEFRVPISTFYNIVVDQIDFVADYLGKN